MSVTRRLYSTASSVASSLLATTRGSIYRHQFLDRTQLLRLNATLPPTTNEPNYKSGSLVLPCHHLVFFTPSDIEAELGVDGTDRTFSPQAPFTRRMWAGGELEWTGKFNLRNNKNAIEYTTLKGAKAKKTKSGEEMIVVEVEKKYEAFGGVALIERRDWLFRPAIDLNHPLTLPPQPPPVPLPSGAPHFRDIEHTPISLFRFSALTFNAHRIHYDREWCRSVEGHRDLVVHAPLNLIHMVDFWRDNLEPGNTILPKKVSYRATNPFYVGEKYRITMDKEEGKITQVKIVDGFGNVGMTATIERF